MKKIALIFGLGLIAFACGDTASEDDDGSAITGMGGSTDKGDGDGDGEQPELCGGGTIQCGAQCADLSNDPQNCGDCANECAEGEYCSEGECGTTCSGGTKACGELCVNLETDRNNCGSCGETCKSGELCSEGECATSCSDATRECSGECVDVDDDAANCGKCGNSCASGEACIDGSCELSCTTSQIACNGECINPEFDARYCGAQGSCMSDGVGGGGGVGGASFNSVGQTCAAGDSCQEGSCELSCQAGLDNCSGTCTNLLTSRENCGECGTSCDPGTVCSNGLCETSCQAGLDICDDTCTDLSSNNSHCGSCGESCGADEACSNGECRDLACDRKLIHENFNGFRYWAVQVDGPMSDEAVLAACQSCAGDSVDVPCTGLEGCGYNGPACIQTSNETSCGNPMNGLSQELCSSYPSGCPDLFGVYQYMGGTWADGSSCGAESGTWCTQGNNYSDKTALCVEAVD